jgi:hypothetical protein
MGYRENLSVRLKIIVAHETPPARRPDPRQQAEDASLLVRLPQRYSVSFRVARATCLAVSPQGRPVPLSRPPLEAGRSALAGDRPAPAARQSKSASRGRSDATAVGARSVGANMLPSGRLGRLPTDRYSCGMPTISLRSLQLGDAPDG